jgi:regulator of protease activity HflC (stomatin/prohibitin superfamily)
MTPIIAIGLLLAVLVAVTAWKTAKVVPEQSAFVIERLGSYNRTLDAGLNFLIPFVDKVAYKLSLKEEAIDIPEQMCITKDNVMVGVDGVIYIKVLEPRLAAYEVSDYYFALIQLTQTTLRSEIGKIELDKTFEARQQINQMVVEEVDKASEAWGVKVLRYEIRNINPPRRHLRDGEADAGRTGETGGDPPERG